MKDFGLKKTENSLRHFILFAAAQDIDVFFRKTEVKIIRLYYGKKMLEFASNVGVG